MASLFGVAHMPYGAPWEHSHAYEDYLEDINEDELPTLVRKPFVELQQDMHRVAPLNGEGTICASVRKMSPEEAGECAVAVVTMYREMIRHSDSAQSDLPLDA